MREIIAAALYQWRSQRCYRLIEKLWPDHEERAEMLMGEALDEIEIAALGQGQPVDAILIQRDEDGEFRYRVVSGVEIEECEE